MEPIDTGNQVRNTLSSDVETIDMEYLLEDNQRVVNFLAAGTQEDTQRYFWPAGGKDRPGMGGSESCVTKAKNTSQTGYIYLR